MTPRKRPRHGASRRVAHLESRLRDAEETLRAIRGGDVDAIVVYGPQGERVFTLRGAEHSYRLLVEAMREGAATVAHDGTVLYCNAAFVAMLGVPSERVIGSALASHVTPAHAPAVAALLARARLGDPTARGELALLGRGAPVPVLLSANVMTVEGEELLAVVATDMSEVERLEEALRGRDEFLSIASHELKTPLTALLLQLDGVLRVLAREEPTPVLRERLDSARRQGRRLAHLVDDLLDVSRIRGGRFALSLGDVDLAAVAREVVDRHRREALALGCTIEVVAPVPVEGLWDRSRLDQVTTNLVTNAIKYGKGKPVRVEVLEVDGAARLVVTDQGIGVDPADHGRIFDRFERAAPVHEYGGMGLGLWIAREIVLRLDGAIRVESELGRGARFVVELPTRPAAAKGSAA